jgi:hypothetical protein
LEDDGRRIHDGYIDYMENNGGIEPAEKEEHVDATNKSRICSESFEAEGAGTCVHFTSDGS